MKTCSKCGAEKPVAAFSRDRSKPDGRYPRCKACNAAYRAANKEKRAAYNAANKEKIAAYNAANKERITAYNAAYKAANKEKRAAYKAANKEKIAAYNAATKERRAAYGQAWRLLHPERVNALNAKRHAAKRQRTPPWLTAEHPAEIEAHYALAKEAEQIAGEPHHVDHIVPLQGRKVSGLHVPWNMQILPASSNIRKSNKWPT